MQHDGGVGHCGTQAVQHLVEHAPSTGGLALWVRHEDVNTQPDLHSHSPGGMACPVSTDGTTLFYSQAFAELPLKEQAGCVAHGVLHIALRHPQRLAELGQLMGDVDERLFNICADAIVNSSLGHLPGLSLQPGAVRLGPLLKAALERHEPEARSLSEWDVERLYRAIDDRRATSQSASRSRTGPRDGEVSAPRAEQRADGPRAAAVRAMGRRTAPDLRPGSADALASPEQQATLTREWQTRIQRAHSDDGEYSMLLNLIADLPTERMPWEQVLRTRLARYLAPQPALSWSRPSRSYIANQARAGSGRRMPWEPGRRSTRPVPRLAVLVDVSGSVDIDLVARFTQEIESIVRRTEAALVLIVGDDQVRRVNTFEPGHTALDEIDFQGVGGTDLAPLLEEAQRHRPDAVVVLTDLDGPADFRPPWPVLWAVPVGSQAVVPPFGHKLVLV